MNGDVSIPAASVTRQSITGGSVAHIATRKDSKPSELEEMES